MDEQEFLKQIEMRLEENRKVLKSSSLPIFLQPLAAYLGFHTFRVLFVTSLTSTILMYVFFRDWLGLVNSWLFGI